MVYGSTRGGTAGLAHMVADACAGHGLSTAVRRAGDVRDIASFDAVIVGGALYGNRWHPDAIAFVGRHRAALRQLPVWFFSSGPLDDSARSGALAAIPQVSKLAREIDIRGHMTFGGMLDKRPTGLFAMSSWRTEGDFRDRHHVAEWVARIAGELDTASAGTVRVIEPSQPVAPTPVAAPDHPAPAPDLPRPAADLPRPEPSTDLPAPAPKVGRLRRYLALDQVGDDEDDGLDLFDDEDEESGLVLGGADQA